MGNMDAHPHTDIANTDAGWVSCAELAQRKGKSRQAITKRVNALEREGRISTRRNGRARLVNMAEYDTAVGEVGDSIKEAAADTAKENGKPASPENFALRTAQADRAVYEAQLKAIDLAERQSKILPIDGPHGIHAAATRMGEKLAADINGMGRYADELTEAATSKGVAGVRQTLKRISAEIRKNLAASMMTLTSEGQAMEADGEIETEMDLM